jgi:hypothetical protein
MHFLGSLQAPCKKSTKVDKKQYETQLQASEEVVSLMIASNMEFIRVDLFGCSTECKNSPISKVFFGKCRKYKLLMLAVLACQYHTMAALVTTDRSGTNYSRMTLSDILLVC